MKEPLIAGIFVVFFIPAYIIACFVVLVVAFIKDIEKMLNK